MRINVYISNVQKTKYYHFRSIHRLSQLLHCYKTRDRGSTLLYIWFIDELIYYVRPSLKREYAFIRSINNYYLDIASVFVFNISIKITISYTQLCVANVLDNISVVLFLQLKQLLLQVLLSSLLLISLFFSILLKLLLLLLVLLLVLLLLLLLLLLIIIIIMTIVIS